MEVFDLEMLAPHVDSAYVIPGAVKEKADTRIEMISTYVAVCAAVLLICLAYCCMSRRAKTNQRDSPHLDSTKGGDSQFAAVVVGAPSDDQSLSATTSESDDSATPLSNNEEKVSTKASNTHHCDLSQRGVPRRLLTSFSLDRANCAESAESANSTSASDDLGTEPPCQKLPQNKEPSCQKGPKNKFLAAYDAALKQNKELEIRAVGSATKIQAFQRGRTVRKKGFGLSKRVTFGCEERLEVPVLSSDSTPPHAAIVTT